MDYYDVYPNMTPEEEAKAHLEELLGERQTPPCRVCGSGKWVAVWEPSHPERTICVECCGGAEHHDGERGHQFEYERLEGHMCRYCGSRDLPRDWGDE